jgi:hypothetical protein
MLLPAPPMNSGSRTGQLVHPSWVLACPTEQSAGQSLLKLLTTKNTKSTYKKIAKQFFIRQRLFSCFLRFSWLKNISMASAGEIKKLNAIALEQSGKTLSKK